MLVGSCILWLGETFHSLRYFKTLYVYIMFTTVAMMWPLSVLAGNREGNAFLSLIHCRHGILSFVCCVIVVSVPYIVLEIRAWATGHWCYSSFIVLEICFVVLYATPEVAADVCRLMSIHQLAYLSEECAKWFVAK